MADEFQSGGPRQAAMPPTGEAPGTTAGEARGEAAAQTMKQQAGAMWEETKANVRSAVDEQQRTAAGGMADVAGALRSAARQLEGEHKTSPARMVAQAADGLERLAGTLRSKDLDTMVRDAEQFARREPALFLGAAVAVGFLAARFLKSSGGARPVSQGIGDAPSTVSRQEGHLH